MQRTSKFIADFSVMLCYAIHFVKLLQSQSSVAVAQELEGVIH